MADQNPAEEMFAAWQKQIKAGTDAWTRAVSQMPGVAPGPAATPDPTMFWRPFIDQQMATWAQMQGPGPVSPDVLALWKKFLDDWIAAWTTALEKAMGTDAFAEMLGKTLDQFLTAQAAARKAADKAGKATIETLGLPSRDQVTGIARQLMDLEDRIEWLEDRLVTLGDTIERSSPNRHPKAAAKTKAKRAKRGGGPAAAKERE